MFSTIKSWIILFLFLAGSASSAWAEGVSTPAAGSAGGMPTPGGEGDCALVSGGTWVSDPCPGAGAGAPTDATYWVGASNGTLSAEINLGALGTGLVINTAGTPSIYAGVTCTNQVLRVLGASGAGTCNTITSAFVDTSIWTGTVSSGLLKATSQGVLAQATAGTDYVIPGGNVATATALSANPADCAANNFATTIAANGDLTCAQPSISAGVSGLGTGVATFLGTPSSANLIAAVTNETGTGALVFATSPTLVTPLLGTPTSGVLTNATGLPLTSGVTGTLPVANGGTGLTTFSDDQILVGTATAVFTAKSIPDCDDSAGNHINYDTTANAFSCGTSSSASGIGGSLGSTDNAIPRANGTGGATLQSSGCTIDDSNVLTCAGGFVAGTSGVGTVTMLEGTAPGAGAASGEHNLYFDSTGSLLKSHENGGSVVTYYSTANAPTTITGNAGTATALAANPSDCSANNFATSIDAEGDLTCGQPSISAGVSGLGTGVATFLGTPSSANLASAVTGETGSGALVFATSPALVTPDLGTPSAGTLTNATGLPIASGVSGLGTGVATALATPSSANLAAAITNETGSGALVFGTAPIIDSPSLTTKVNLPRVTAFPGSPSAGDTVIVTDDSAAGACDSAAGAATSLCQYSGSAWVKLGDGTGAGGGLLSTDIDTSSELAGIVGDETGSGALVFANTPTLVTPILGTPTSGTLTNATGLPISTGVSGLGTGVATFLATPSSANLRSAITDESGTGVLIFADGAIGAATATTPSANDNDTSVATTAYVQTELTAYASDTVTFTNKTLTTPIISSISNTGTITLPTATDTLVGKATTDTLTNKTLDAEGTGNLLTIPHRLWFPAAGCNNATAGSVWDLPTSNPAVAACKTGTNTQLGVLDFADSANLSAQVTHMLPTTWTGTIDANIKWMTTATTGSVVWQLSTICVANAETDDPAFNTASTVTDAALGTTLQTNDAAITTVTVTGCAAGELMHLRIQRDSAHASDNLAATARLIGVQLVIREAL